MATAAPVSAAAGGVFESATKQLVGRSRPATSLFTNESGYGFPSGHTTGFAAMAVATVVVMAVLGFRRRQVLWAAAVATVLSVVVAGSRVVVGAHWPTDVVGGLLLGPTIALITVHALTHVARRIQAPDRQAE
jgi:undecaprenyl-diphosphatase